MYFYISEEYNKEIYTSSLESLSLFAQKVNNVFLILLIKIFQVIYLHYEIPNIL